MIEYKCVSKAMRAAGGLMEMVAVVESYLTYTPL